MGRDLKICHKKGIDIKIFIFTKKIKIKISHDNCLTKL